MSSLQMAAAPPAIFRKGAKILFQGDSITDGGRSRDGDPNHDLGHGYAYLIAADAAAHFPERNLTFHNRGVSGNKISDLVERWRSHTIDLRPDIVSILIGVNDIWHNLDAGNEVPIRQFEQDYDKLLRDTLVALPRVKLVLCEPFMLEGQANRVKFGKWAAALEQIQRIVAGLGDKYQAPVIQFQKTFDAACRQARAEYWIWDGVHPTHAGHQLMADEWVHVVTDFWRE